MSRPTMINKFKRNYAVIILSIIIVFYLFNGIQYLRSQSLTTDELPYYSYANRFIKGHPEKEGNMVDDSKMPVMVFNLVPRMVLQFIHPALKKSDLGESDIIRGRYITMFISVFIILLVYKWAMKLYGINAGLFAAFLMSFCPNNLANAGLVTEDSYCVLALLAVMYCTWQFCTTKSNKYFIFLCCAVAFAQLVKQTLFHVYLLVPLCFVVYYFVNKPSIKLAAFLKYAAVFFIINWFIINAVYYFYQTNTPLGNYHFISGLFKPLQRLLPSWFPMPLPKPFVDGMDMVKYNNDLGGGGKQSTFAKVTILGHASTGGSFWYYYLVSCFFKTPISYFIFITAGLWAMVKSQRIKSILGKEFFLILPVVYFLIVMSVAVKIQTGMRHIIFIYPFLFILSAGIIPYIKSRYAKMAVVATGAFLVISVLQYWRNYFPYTNEFIADKKMAYSYVGFDNLDYDQGRYFYKEYLNNHPNVQWVSLQPKAGIFLLTSREYLDVWNLHQYDWITHFKPTGQVAYSGLLIEVTAKDIAH